MDILTVQDLCKSYPSFHLKNISFTLEKGKITGFIGRNGAGKTTALGSLLHFVQPDSGNVLFFGMPFSGHETEIKQRIGFVSGGVDYYPGKKLKTITSVTRRFYPRWDDGALHRYFDLFQLDENKTPAQLSAGMKVKYALALALSHNAELLILDEPTSGLDPVSRDELLSIFMNLSDKGVTILFSTHITSDLDKCADNILYIKEGKLLAESSISAFVDSYRLLQLSNMQLAALPKEKLIGCKRSKTGYTAIIRVQDARQLGLSAMPADLEDIMVHIEKEGE